MYHSESRHCGGLDASQLPDDDSTDSLLFAKLCDDFSRKALAGEHVSIEDYIDQYPRFAQQIRTAFPAMAMMTAVQVTPRDDESVYECPKEIAGCKIVRCIGRGGMGVVYEAMHPTVSRRVAIKVLKTHRQRERSLRERFIREAEASSRLNHPNIVPFIDCGEDAGTAYLSMLYIEGESLDFGLTRYWNQVEKSQDTDQCQLRSAQVSPQANSEVARPSSGFDDAAEGKTEQSRLGVDLIAKDFKGIALLGADVAAALAHAHERNAIHRDIKPANLILDNGGKVWVTDFGLAKLHDDESDLSKTGDMIGTPRYMAPEQFRGIADERSDIYSLGVTLYELVTGAKAWDGDAARRSKSRRTNELPAIHGINPSVPPALARIITKACAHSAGKRYASASDLQFALNQFAHSDSVIDRRSLARGSRKRSIRTRELLLTAVFVMALAVAVKTYNDRTLPVYFAASNNSVTADAQTGTVNLSPVIGDNGPRIVDVREATTDLHELQLTGSDPNGDPFCWLLLPDADASHFITQRLSGHLCFRSPPRVTHPDDFNSDNIYELRLAPTDQFQPHVAVFLSGSEQTEIQMHQPTLGVTVSTKLPRQLMTISTLDGKSFLYTSLSNDGTVALYRSTLNGEVWTSELLQANCLLTPFLRALACESDEMCLSILQTRDGFVLQWLRLDERYRFHAIGRSIALDILQEPIGLSCLGRGDFQVLDRRGPSTILLEVAVSQEDGVVGVRELPVGWNFGSSRLYGMAAWITASPGNPIEEAAVQDVNIRVLPSLRASLSNE